MASVDLHAETAERHRSEPRRWSPTRRAGVLGLLFVVGFLVAFFGLPGNPPDVDATAGEMRAYVSENRTVLLAHVLAGMAVFVLLLPAFAAATYHVTAIDRHSVWPTLSLVGALLIVAMTITGGSLAMLSAYLATGSVSDDTVQILFIGDLLVFSVFVPWAMALFASATAMSLRAATSLPGWVSVSGMAVSVPLVIGTVWVFGDATGPLAYLDFASIVLWAVWVLVTSALMMRASMADDPQR